MSRRRQIESESSVDDEILIPNGTSSSASNGRQYTAYDWEAEKNRRKEFFDDGTTSFFWRAHTITVLVVFSCILFYVAVIERDVTSSSEYNTKRGLVFTMLAFLLFGVIHTPDGPFRRPHPAFWRFILCLSILYALLLIFLLFQNVDDARKMLRHFDSDLGKPLPEKDYGSNCFIYDPQNATHPFHNVMDKMDGFVIVHFIGWWLKTLILRDYWLCTVLSFMFEVLEYTLEHQLPNFSECWWDHWIMDFLVCNYFGIYLGMKTCKYLSMKPYHWSSMWKIPGYKGKLKRIALQFTPHRWTDFDWKVTHSLTRWVAMLGVIGMFLLAELNTFYLKFVLWVPPPHFLCLGRLVFFLFMGATSMREVFQYLDDPHNASKLGHMSNCKRFGRQSWIIAVIIITEFLIVLKFDWETVTKPLPTHILIAWSLGLTVILLWSIWNFFIKRLLVHSARKQRAEKRLLLVKNQKLSNESNGIVTNDTNSANATSINDEYSGDSSSPSFDSTRQRRRR